MGLLQSQQRMATGWLAAPLCVVGPLTLATANTDTLNIRLFWWLILLTLGLAAADYYFHQPTLSQLRPKNGYKPKFENLLIAAAYRWFAWLLLLAVGFVVYNVIPHYQSPWYQDFRDSYFRVMILWLAFGFFYHFFSLKYRAGVSWDRKDPAVYVLMVIRHLWRRLTRKAKPISKPSLIWESERARKTFLGLLVKAFFLPIMTSFFFSGAKNTIEMWHNLANLLRHADSWTIQFYASFTALYKFLIESLLLIDVTIAVLGYTLTTRWLNNGISSVDQTGLGWLTCLACYRPFNDLTERYFPWPTTDISTLADTPIKLMLMTLVLGLLAIYVWATMAFGLRFSNLTYRGVISKGPYQFIRHPAYAAKSAAWWVEFLPSFSNLTAVLYMASWTLLYYLRAYTEERHLLQFKDYRAYVARVRWRFIPGIF